MSTIVSYILKFSSIALIFSFIFFLRYRFPLHEESIIECRLAETLIKDHTHPELSRRLNQAPYQGISFFLIPFSLPFGCNNLVIRISETFWLWLTIIMLYICSKNIYDKETGFLSAALLLTLPYFILVAWAENPQLVFFAILIFYLFFKSNENGKYFYAAFLFAGIGSQIKMSIGIIIISLLISHFLLEKKGVNFKKIIISSTLFFLGVFPLLFLNWFYGFPFLLKMTHNISFSQIVMNFFQRTHNLYWVLSGLGNFYGLPLVNPFNFFIFLLAFLALSVEKTKKDLFPLLFIAFFFVFLPLLTMPLLTIFPDKFCQQHQIFPILPILPLITARFLIKLKNKCLPAMILLIILLFVPNLISLVIANNVK